MRKDKNLPISKGKMSTSLSEVNLEKKFQGATNTQDSIQTLSLWLLHHKAHHQKIVSSWMKVLQKAKISHRLTLFYLANDVVQNSKRKNFVQFANSFAEVLREATLLVRNDTIRPSILRVFNIWEQRNVYSAEFIADLRAILANTKVPATAPSKLLAQFKPETVIEKIRLLSKLEVEVNNRITNINLSKLKATDAEIVQHFKDRIHGQQFKREFDDSASRLEELIKLMEKEMTERTELILLLEQSEIYYDTQKGEAKIVANAYKNFGGRIEKLQKKLEEINTTLPSPLPSPTLDAPSPTTSDQELELNLPADNPQEKDLENLENAPSPEGSPEGLVLPESVDEEKEKPDTKCVGNPIPTLSNFFTHEEKGMTSWLDAFAHKKESLKIASEKKSEIKKGEGGSLESRLSNLIQNMPSLPAGLQNTLFNNNTSSSNVSLGNKAESTVGIKKEKGHESSTSILTPIKDDYSGQNTPLQDEDTHSSHAFFSKLASSNKTHSPKDILKGLTNLIQSASAEKDDSQKRDKFTPFPSTDLFEPQTGMSTFIKNIIPSISRSPQISSSPSTYFNTSQSTTVRTLSSNIVSTVNSYQTVPFNNIPTYSTCSIEQNEHRSFIPSLVPSTTQESFGFTSQTFPSDEYNPEMEIFDTDMDIENEDEDGDLDVPSPDHEPLSPTVADSTDEVMDIPRSIPRRRSSTLITLVTDDSPEASLPENQFISDDIYKSDKENFTDIPPWLDDAPNNTVKSGEPMPAQVNSPQVNSPNEEYFIGKPSEPQSANFYTSAPPPPIPPIMSPPNEQNSTYINPLTPTETPLSRIETVQSHRGDMNGRWFNNDNWSENRRNPFPGPPPLRRGPPDGNFFNNNNDNNRNFSPRHFQPRQNWPIRNRPDHQFHQKRDHSFSPRPYGPPLNKRFPFRGRGGWGRNPQY